MLEQAAEHFPSEFRWEMGKLESVLLQSLVASISPPASQTRGDPQVPRWLYKHFAASE